MYINIYSLLCSHFDSSHLGNTWYRRLVRSNRALYKKSPKHTKLLVSKAIVHHVQNQNPSGRFLECHKTTGRWSNVPYKRAVDKTSQALREREREGEDIDDDDDEDDEPLTSSNGMPSSLSDLAQAAVTQANILHPKIALPPPPTIKSNAVAQPVRSSLAVEVPPPPGEVNKRPLERGSSWFGFAAKRLKVEDDPIPLPTVPLQQRSSSVFRFFQTSSLFGGSQAQVPVMDSAPQQTIGYSHFQPVLSSFSAPNQSVSKDDQMQPSNIHQAISTVSHAGTQNFGIGTTSSSQMTGANFAQMMHDASSQAVYHFGQAPSNGSLLGLIQQGMSQDMTHVFNNSQSSIFNQGNILSTPASYGYPTLAGQIQLPYATQQFPSNSSLGYEEQLQSYTKQGRTSSTTVSSVPLNDGQNFVSQEFEPRPLAGDFKQGGAAPGLTRFTTQVSDWLTSFWPLQREQSSEISQQQVHQLQQLERNNMNQQFSDGNMQGQQQAVQTHIQHLGMFQQQHMEQVGSVQRRQQTQQQISRIGGGGPQPPQLSQSVSSTFLKLATNPSRIFSGLSTFFDRNQNPSQVLSTVTAPFGKHASMGMNTGTGLQHQNIENGGNQNMSNNTLGIQAMPSIFMENQSIAFATKNDTKAAGGNATSLGPPLLGQPAKGTKAAAPRSLLDDYEDTPMELRLRTVSSR